MVPRVSRSKVLLVEDHPLVCEGMAARINRESDLVVCGAVESAKVAMRSIHDLQPQCVVTDIALSEGDGLDLVKNLRTQYPKLPVLVHTMYEETLYAERAIRAGAKGFIMKNASPEELVNAVRTVLRGQTYLSPQMTSIVLSRLATQTVTARESPVEQLSDRELQLYQLIGRGVTTGVIAKTLHISPKTIASHRENIKRKLKLRSGLELVRHAVQWTQTSKTD
jgi:DNA-binding NarL/FixJ family response regulator